MTRLARPFALLAVALCGCAASTPAPPPERFPWEVEPVSMESITDVLAATRTWDSASSVIGVVQARVDDRYLVFDVAIIAGDASEAAALHRKLNWGLDGCAIDVNDGIHMAFDGAIPTNASVGLVQTSFCGGTGGLFSSNRSHDAGAYFRHLNEAVFDVEQIGEWHGRPVFWGRLPFKFFAPNYPDPLSSDVSDATQSVHLPISRVLCRTYWESADTVVVDSTIRVVPLVAVSGRDDEDLTRTQASPAPR